MRPKAVIVGAGLMGNWHAYAIRRVGAKLNSVVDCDADAGKKLASHYQANHFPDLGTFLDHNTCDVVHICTPVRTHFLLAMQALDAGCNVLVEKPLALNGRETLALANRAAETGKLLCPVHQYPFQPGFADLRAELKKRASPPLGISFDIASAGGEAYPKEQLNSLLLEILPHPLSVLNDVWPQAGTDQSKWTISWPINGEMIAHYIHNGIPILIRISLHARPAVCSMSIQHQDGAIEYNFFHGYTVFDSPRVSRTRKIAGPFNHSVQVMSSAGMNLFARLIRRQWAYPGLEDLIRQFYAAVNHDIPLIEAERYVAIAHTCDYFRHCLPDS